MDNKYPRIFLCLTFDCIVSKSLPFLQKDVSEQMPGYLSIHQTAQSLTVKWTPNQLMNGYTECEVTDKSSYWAYALNINVDEIVYVHCHQIRGEDTGGTIIFVGQDGVQHPPILFPEGGHMAAFLSCLETGENILSSWLELYKFEVYNGSRSPTTRTIGSSAMVNSRNWQNFPMAS